MYSSAMYTDGHAHVCRGKEYFGPGLKFFVCTILRTISALKVVPHAQRELHVREKVREL